MKTILKNSKWFYAITLSIWLFVSCDVLSSLGVGRIGEEYSLIPTEGLSTTHIPNESFFYVNLYAAYYVGEGFDALDSIIYAMDDGPGTDCKIPVEQESTEDLYCIMDVMEGDLWFHNIVLEYNVPEEMCDYLDFDVPWHFNQRVGEGPPTIYQCNRGRCVGSGDDVSLETETIYCLNTCGSLLTGACTDNNQEVTVGCSSGISVDDPQKFCGILDQSENDLANCCLGEYTLNSGETISEVNWGGNVNDCIGGLGRTSWDAFNHEGLPIGTTAPTLKDGYRNTYEIPALIDKYDGRKNNYLTRLPTFITANYWTDAENKDSASNKPDFYIAPQTLTEFEGATYLTPYIGAPHGGHPYLTWSCLDKAREIKHRIHLLIREWNTQEEYNSYKETEGSRGDPDVGGSEGTECDYYESEEASVLKDTACNDFTDIDDWDAQIPGYPYPEVIYQ